MKKKRRKRYRIRKLRLLIYCIILVSIGIVCMEVFGPKVNKSLTLEAGNSSIDVKDFLLDKGDSASFVTDISSLNLNNPGVYEIQIKVGRKVYTSSLNIVDSIAPVAEIKNQVSHKGEMLEADVFVTNINDASDVTVSYKEIPDFNKTGEQQVMIVIKDSGNNIIQKSASLTILDVKKRLTVETGTEMVPASNFLNHESYTISYASDIQGIDLNKPNVYDVEIRVDNHIIQSQLEVADTSAPEATVVNQETWINESIDAKEFVTNIIDESEVNVFFGDEPDFSKAGVQNINIVLEDISGNKSTLPALLTIKEDKEAPVITGTLDKTVYIGDRISYKKNIIVTDNKDEEVQLEIDSSTVNLQKVGTYTVTYSATDSSGNNTTKTIDVIVKEYQLDIEVLDQLAGDILNNIINDDMTITEKAYEIYKWTKSHITYTGHSDKSDWIKEAYNGITDAVGDCFTYFAVSQLLLNKADIENMDVTRVGGKTRHYWSMVKFEDGWYHFDSCPNKDHKESFKLTDARVNELTLERGNNYYIYEFDSYPKTPTN